MSWQTLATARDGRFNLYILYVKASPRPHSPVVCLHRDVRRETLVFLSSLLYLVQFVPMELMYQMGIESCGVDASRETKERPSADIIE